MALSAFEDKARAPEGDELEAILGPTAPQWNEIVAAVSEKHGPIDRVWSFAGPKFGWSLRLKLKERVILYLIPQAGIFLVGVVLGEKAVARAHHSGLPGSVLALIDAARPYAEGRGIRVPVKGSGDVEVILELAALKLGR